MMSERRVFLLNTVKNLGLATSGGLTWSAFIEEGKSAPLILRPPGALPEKEFIVSCTKCGICVEACPYNALILAEPGDNKPIGTPYFIPRNNPCRMCSDIPCVHACPTEALDRSKVSENDERGVVKFNVNLAKMGLAVIDRKTCIAYSGIQCDACYRICPLIDKAITVKYTRIERTGKHAMLAPVVHSNACTGCGLCEKACVTQKASIFVLPHEIAMGETSSRYLKGQDSHDEERLKDISEDAATETSRCRRKPEDYLNDSEF